LKKNDFSLYLILEKRMPFVFRTKVKFRETITSNALLIRLSVL